MSAPAKNWTTPREASTPTTLAALLVVVSAVLASIALALFSSRSAAADLRPLALLGVGSITVMQVVALRWATRRGMPLVSIPIAVLNFVGTAGYLYYRDVSSVAHVSFQLPTGSTEFDAALRVFAFASAALFAGGLLAGIGRQRHRAASGADTADLAAAVSRLPRGPVLAACTIPVAFEILAIGPAGLISRAFYLDAAGPSWTVSIGQAFIPVAVAVTAVIFFDRARQTGRVWAALLLFIDFTAVFARGSRLIGVLPLIVLAAYLIQRRGQRVKSVLAAIVALTLSILLVQLPLASRARNQGAGLAPYISALVADPGAALGRDGAAGFIGNVLYSVPLAGFVATDIPPEPTAELYASVNPMPGGLAAWNTYSDAVRIDVNTPYSALGELGLSGTAVLIGYFSIVGYIATRLQIVSRRLTGLRPTIMELALGGLLLSFSLSVLQYNLRTGSRYMWYAVGIYLVLRLARLPKRFKGAASSCDGAALDRGSPPSPAANPSA